MTTFSFNLMYPHVTPHVTPDGEGSLAAGNAADKGTFARVRVLVDPETRRPRE